MRLLSRFILLALPAAFGILVLINHLKGDLWNQYSVGSYVASSLSSTFHPQLSTYQPPSSDSANGYADGIGPDKIIVMARTSHESTLWVEAELAGWQNAIYTVDARDDNETMSELASGPALSSTLHTPANKGHEAMAYLTFIVDHYNDLPAIMAFIHPHRSGFFEAWHTDTPLHSNVDALDSLNLTHVRNQGYVNLRCKHKPGCSKSDYSPNGHVTEEIWSELFRSTSTPPAKFPFPGNIGQTCCAQFAVSREAVLQRPVGDYDAMRDWLLETELPDRKSGRVFEFLWHVIFGMESVHCPEETTCYCQVYGRC